VDTPGVDVVGDDGVAETTIPTSLRSTRTWRTLAQVG
jgi:hypothetical protein